MNDINHITLTGRLTRDPELRTLPSGSSVVQFTLALNRKFGEGKEETSFIDVEAWNKLAEIIANIATKGSSVLVTGRIKQDSWQSDDGPRSKIITVADEFLLMRTAKSQEE